jgi:hypothetical protein
MRLEASKAVPQNGMVYICILLVYPVIFIAKLIMRYVLLVSKASPGSQKPLDMI